MDSISEKAQRHIVKRQHGGHFNVISADSDIEYEVTLTPASCNCRYHRKTGRECSHIIAAQMAKDEVSAAIKQEAKDGGFDSVTDYVNSVLLGGV